MTEKNNSKLLVLVTVTVIVMAFALGVAVTYMVDNANSEKKSEEITTDDISVIQIGYGAYATYTLTAKCDGTVKASDGGAFLVNGESVNTFNFVKNTTYTLTFYGGAVPEVSR